MNPKTIKNIIKRNGVTVPFEKSKMLDAINKAMIASEEGSYEDAVKVADNVYQKLLEIDEKNFVPTVEFVQEKIEQELMMCNFVKTSRNYILYRSERDNLRSNGIVVPEHVKKLAEESKKYFRNPLSEFVYYRTYAKWIEKEGRRETWIETVDRYVNFMKEKLGDMLKDSEYKEVRESILKQEVMPSMRLLQFAGPAADRTNVCAYNCSFIAPSKIEDFGEILYILMCGTGVGFSVESQNVDKLPAIVRQCEGNNIIKHTVEDSKEGWADALTLGIKTWFNGDDVIFDYSLLRPAGARLKTFGGKSSGPQPLINLLNFTRERILKRASSKLRNVDVHDIVCKIGECVVSGGVRRSALISLSDLNDTEMREAKTGQFWNTEGQRMLANNSAVYKTKPTETEFLKEWLALMESGTGERGIFNRGGLAKTLPERRLEVSEKYFDEFGTNPSLRAGTRILTKNGVFKIEKLEGQTFFTKNLNGNWSPAKCFLSSNNAELYKIDFGAGRVHYATKEHKWPVITSKGIVKKTTLELKNGDKIPKIQQSFILGKGKSREEGFVIGWLYGDGWITERKNGNREYGFIFNENEKYLSDSILNFVNNIKDNKSSLNDQHDGTYVFQISDHSFDSLMRTRNNVDKKENGIPDSVFNSGIEYAIGFIDGLFSSDGCVSGKDVVLVSSRLKLLEDLSQLLSFLGINSDIRKRKPKHGIFPNGKDYKKIYYSYVLRISRGSIGDFRKLINKLSHKEKNNKISLLNSGKPLKKYERVKSVENTKEKEPVWDITVNDNTHCFYIPWVITGNCGEIILRSRQFCNLSEVIARSEDTEESLMKKIKIATILGTYQSTLTKFGYLSREWKKNCEEERLLGVSVTGQWDSKIARNPEILEKLKKESIRINKLYAKRFGVSESTCITAVKPSGTVSQTVDCASGMHPRHSQYYIRRVRISATDSLFKMMKDQGVPYYPEVGQQAETANTYVLEFPVKAPEGAICKDDITAIDQLEHWKTVKVNYTEHNPSVTVSVGDDEWIEVANWVYKNWDIVGGLSFLPRSNHVYQLAPYESITKEKYEDLISKMPDLDFSKIVIYELKDETEVKKELACAGKDTCDIF